MADDGDNGPDSVEAKGKNVDEAIENALVDLELERHEVSVEVLSEGRAGLFGIGGEPARVLVSAASYEIPEGDDVGLAVETLIHLMELMGVEATCEVRAPETPGDGAGLMKAVLDVTGEDLGVLIGRRGGTMAALQYMVNLLVSKKIGEHEPFAVDVEGYRRRREEALLDLAFETAERVRRSGRPVTLEPMPANERRIIHLALSKDPTVGTSSIGEGESRKVAIRVQT